MENRNVITLKMRTAMFNVEVRIGISIEWTFGIKLIEKTF